MKLLAGLSLAIGLLGVFMAGSLTSDTFSLSLYREFNYTSSDVQATNFVRLIGTSFTIPAGVAYANLGPMKVGIISLVLSTIGVLLMWSCTMATEFFSSNAWLFGFFSLLAGHGSTYLYMGALNCTIRNVPPHRKALIIGSMNSVYIISSVLFSIVFQRFFNSTSSMWRFETDNLSGYLILITVGFAVINVFTVFGLREYPPEFSHQMATVPTYPDVRAIVHSAYEYPESNEDLINSYSSDPTPVVGSSPQAHLSFQRASGAPLSPDTERLLARSAQLIPVKPLVTEALKRREFHFLTAAFACGTGAAATVASSLETLLNCMGASHDLNIIMGLLIIGTCLTAIPIGILSDYYSHRVNRLGYSLPSSIGFFVSCVFCAVLLSADNSGTLVGILSLFVGCYLGSVFSVIPATIVDLYGIQRFPVLWGWLMSASALSYLTQKKIFEAIFNSQLSSHSLCSATLAPHLSLAMPSGYLFASIFLTIGALQMT